MFFKPVRASFYQPTDVLAPWLGFTLKCSPLPFKVYATVILETGSNCNYYIPMLWGGERNEKEEEG